MVPALHPGDRVVTLPRPPGMDDLVVFVAPGGMIMVKRVVALPGDTVAVSGGRVVVDGVARHDVLDTPGEGRWTLSPDEYFVLSDARDLTRSDSRTFGPVPAVSLLGTVVYRYWPPSRVGRPPRGGTAATSW